MVFAFYLFLRYDNDPPEECPSGRRSTLGKRVCVNAYHGFESHLLRFQTFSPVTVIREIVPKALCDS